MKRIYLELCCRRRRLGMNSAVCAILLHSAILLGAELDTNCKKFQDLSRQDKIRITAKLSDSVLIAHESIFPELLVLNLTDQYVEVPDFDHATGIFVETSDSALRSPSSYRRRPQEESQFCSIATMLLAPRELKSFRVGGRPLDSFVNRVSLDQLKVIQGRIATARSKVGDYQFRVLLGSLPIEGNYKVVTPEVLDHTCIKKEIMTSTEANPGQPAVESVSYDYCLMAVILKIGEESQLFVGGVPTTVKIYNNNLDGLERQARGISSPAMYPFAAVRLLKWSENTRFAISRSKVPIDSRSFAIVRDGGARLSMDDVKAQVSALTVR